MNAEENGLSIEERLGLVLTEDQTRHIMGAEPIPSLDIQMDEIQNEL